MKHVLIMLTVLGIIALVIVAALAFRVPITAAHAPEQFRQEAVCKSESLDEQIAKLPDYIMHGFIADGGSVHLTDVSIAEVLKEYSDIEHSEAAQASGVFIVNNGTPEIWLKCPSAALHEFGHWLDWSHSWLSGSDEFLEVYHAEKNSFHRHIDREPHYISVPTEYFAESFTRYLVNLDTLKEHCPKTYNYISNII
jgi:hypothetical protein